MSPARRPLPLLIALLLAWQGISAVRVLLNRGLPPWDASRAGELATLGLFDHDDDRLFERAMGEDWPFYSVLKGQVPRGSVVFFATPDAHRSAELFVRLENLLAPTRILPWNLAMVPASALADWRPPVRRDGVELYLLDVMEVGLPLPPEFAPVENEHDIALWQLVREDG